MSRAKFDREEVLDNAVKLFWQTGFRASSMQEVIKATGLKPGSIYLAFGDKEGLYKEALQSYATKSRTLLRKILREAPNVPMGICAILEFFILDARREDYASCFVIKTQLEMSAQQSDLYTYANDHLRAVENILFEALTEEYEEQEAQIRASAIMLNLFGIRVYGYHKDGEKKMRAALKLNLPWLPWDKVETTEKKKGAVNKD